MYAKKTASKDKWGRGIIQINYGIFMKIASQERDATKIKPKRIN